MSFYTQCTFLILFYTYPAGEDPWLKLLLPAALAECECMCRCGGVGWWCGDDVADTVGVLFDEEELPPVPVPPGVAILRFGDNSWAPPPVPLSPQTSPVLTTCSSICIFSILLIDWLMDWLLAWLMDWLDCLMFCFVLLCFDLLLFWFTCCFAFAFWFCIFGFNFLDAFCLAFLFCFLVFCFGCAFFW